MNQKLLLKNLVKLGTVLGELHELDWFHTLGNNVNYQKYEHEKLVKPKVDHVVGGLSILYLFAIFENYFDNKDWKKYIDSDDEKMLRAFRHIRHSIAHGHHGLRVEPLTQLNKKEYDAFDEAINNNLFSPNNMIILDKPNNTMSISSASGVYLKEFMKKVVSNAIAKVAKEV